MCRLYGFRANQPTKVECTLIHAQNALMIQSRGDMNGLSHTDGWGIAYYSEDGEPVLVKRDTAAYKDLHFPSTVEKVYAQTVVAHVRRATVGKASVHNTHPFAHGPWVFAHNGTLGGFHQVEEGLRQETLPHLLALRKGTTDSEMAFYWILSAMQRAGLDPESRCRDLARLTRVLGTSIADLAERCEATGSKQATRLNFLLTDGSVLLVSRWNRSLFWVQRAGIRDCEICGIPHIHVEGESPYHAVVVASEPISHENWQPVPDRHLAVVNEGVQLELHSIPDLAGSQADPPKGLIQASPRVL